MECKARPARKVTALPPYLSVSRLSRKCGFINVLYSTGLNALFQG
jgi:hypothetical protein